MQFHDDESGDWRGLNASVQTPRYSAIAEILVGLKPDAFVLDVGCGEAVLCSWLPQEFKYLGVEPSSNAVRNAIKQFPESQFVNGTAELFDPGNRRFDCVVFNEMLYYASNPIGLLQKYAKYVSYGGTILCSIYQKPDKISWKRRLRYCLNRRKPLSNRHCEHLIRAFMARKQWKIIDDRTVAIPGSEENWHIWLATPPSSSVT